MRVAALLVLVVCAIPARPADEPHPPTQPADLTPAVVREAITRGTTRLLQLQNPDGSWGGAAGSITTWSGETWSSPESHRAWRVATTGLCCLALMEVGQTEDARNALDRGLDYIIANADVKRSNEWDTMGNWAYIYGLQALAAAYGHPRYAESSRREAIRVAAEACLRQLAYHQSLNGGWGYLEFSLPRTARPQWATSFMTAAGIIALIEAREQGLPVDDAVLERAVKGVRRCWLPNGAYTYSIDTIPNPRLAGSINRVSGSLSRIQSCNLALLMAGDDISLDRLRTGLAQFFEEHRFLDIARLKPVPHEAYYQNSGYFYLFGHYYAARVIERLPPEERREAWPRLQYELIKIQEPDGSLWDYDHHAYARPYGTAYGLMALQRSLQDAESR